MEEGGWTLSLGAAWQATPVPRANRTRQKQLQRRRISWSRRIGSGKEMEMIESLLSAWWIWAVPVAFLAVLFYAFNPKRKKQFEKEARVPLEDDPPVK